MNNKADILIVLGETVVMVMIVVIVMTECGGGRDDGSNGGVVEKIPPGIIKGWGVFVVTCYLQEVRGRHLAVCVTTNHVFSLSFQVSH